MPSQTELPIESEDHDKRSRGQIVGYVRVSSADQNPARQHEVIGRCDRVFEDRMSGKSRAKRKGLADLIAYVRDADTVRVASLDRLGRDTRDLHALVDELTAKGCAVEFVSEGLLALGIHARYERGGNELFVAVPSHLTEPFEETFGVHLWEPRVTPDTDVVRIVTAFDTTDEDVAVLLDWVAERLG